MLYSPLKLPKYNSNNPASSLSSSRSCLTFLASPPEQEKQSHPKEPCLAESTCSQRAAQRAQKQQPGFSWAGFSRKQYSQALLVTLLYFCATLVSDFEL